MNEYFNRIANGMCGVCNKPSDKHVCLICKDKAKEREKLRYKERRSQGLCGHCGNEKTITALCEICKQKNESLRRKRRSDRRKSRLCELCGVQANRRFCGQCANQHKIANKIARRQNDEICTKCGTSETLPNGYCEKCYLKMTAGTHLADSSLGETLKELYLKQDGKCAYTGRKLLLGFNSQIDHIIPRSKGGKNEILNLQWTSTEINFFKRALPEERFKKRLEVIKKYYEPHNLL